MNYQGIDTDSCFSSKCTLHVDLLFIAGIILYIQQSVIDL